MDFYPKKDIYNFREPFFLAEIFEKVSFHPYNFRFTRLSAGKDAFVLFLHFLLKFKHFDEFFFRPKRDGKSLSVCSY